jgi:hypothetical protein
MPTTIVLAAGSSWEVPGDFNPADNTITVIGGGGPGRSNAVGTSTQGRGGSGGGGAGEKRVLTNWDPLGATSIPYSIAPASVATELTGGDTNWNSGEAIAKGGSRGGLGSNPSGGVGGPGGSGGTGGTGTNGSAGGAGTARNNTTNGQLSGSGGGGGASPNAGGVGVTTASGGVGGDGTYPYGDGGTGGWYSGSTLNAFIQATGGTNYGAGGGGGAGRMTTQNPQPGGNGAQGVIIIEYEPIGGDWLIRARRRGRR